MPRLSQRQRAVRKVAFRRSRCAYLRTIASLGLTPSDVAQDSSAWASIAPSTDAGFTGGWGAWGATDPLNPGGGVRGPAGGLPLRPLFRSTHLRGVRGILVSPLCVSRVLGCSYPSMPLLPRRTLRSGKEFSSFDLAIGAAIEPAEFFDVEICLAHHLEEHDEPAAIIDVADLVDTPFWINTPSTRPSPIHHRPPQSRLQATVDVDTAQLPHSKPDWIGLRSAEDESANGMGGRAYTRDEIQALTGRGDLRYINWLGRLSIPIVDSNGRIIAVLGGMPKDVDGWGSFNAEQFTTAERRSLTPQYPGGYHTAGARHELLGRSVSSGLLVCQLCRWPDRCLGLRLRWNFARSVFAACTFNFGPHAITVPHLDFGNLAWGWCAITALGFFDPDLGGHLVLWDLKLVIRFPPGSTILIPSAIIRHSNVPWVSTNTAFRSRNTQQADSFAGSAMVSKRMRHFRVCEPSEKAARRAEDSARWEKGVAMYSR
ncbi:hypothetical protein B0H13DRAFT_1863243 [Mycena leptocephala]|nr:hypothetical protein B0H13DRAFT_1863243 [Mycena leptocephala]